MDTLKKMKLFPDSWYRKLSKKEMEESRTQLKGYTLANTLETGLKEVVILNVLVFGGMYSPYLGSLYPRACIFARNFYGKNRGDASSIAGNVWFLERGGRNRPLND
jgi:hypothetical protein